VNLAALQDAANSILAIDSPDTKSLRMTIALINLVLMCQMQDPDYSNHCRAALTEIRDMLQTIVEERTHD